MSRLQKTELKAIEPYDVSFLEIKAIDNWEATIQRIATAIDVQFTESSQVLPFVPFKEFRSLLHEEKVFLLGPSGCGKSRAIIELLKNNEPGQGRIFIINPASPASLDCGRENISLLSQRFESNDIVIWDNFPNGLIKRDLQSAFAALEIINSTAVRNLYISLKPTYLEIYRGLTRGIPELYTCELTCDLETMKVLLRTYGKVEQFRDVFEKYVSENMDKITRILWQKQPLSLTVVDYYKALKSKVLEQKGVFDSSKALFMAQTWLPAFDYFQRQFEVMKSIEERREDVEFLYVLRFCYEVGFDRTSETIALLQKGIFGSSVPIEPTRRLGTWIYLSGQSYAMHDSAKNAIGLTDHANMKIISYLTESFLEIVPSSSAQLHSLGLFLGKNIHFISTDSKGPVVPEHIYAFMKKNAVFERAIGRGIGEEFEKLDDALQKSILDNVDTEIEFGVGLADSLGERFVELDDGNRKQVLEKIYQGMLFARYFGQSVGRLYGRLSNELQLLVISHSEKNPQFADGLGMGIGYIYTSLEPALQREIMSRAQKSFELSRGLGFGFGLTFSLLQDNESRELVAMADRNSELDTGFGMGLGAGYSSLPDNLQKFVLERASENCEFGFGAAIYCAFSYRESCPKEVLSLLDSNTEIANGLGLGFGTGFFYLPEQFQSELQLLQKTNVKLDDGLGIGIGIVLKHLPVPLQETFFGKASLDGAFATGFGYGVGFTWQYQGEALKEKALSFANANSEFARGFGIGLGSHIDYLKPTLAQIMSVADTNSQLDRGLGAGAAWAWPYFGDDTKKAVIERMDACGEFAKGVGFGIARIVRHFSDEERKWIDVRTSEDPSFSEGFGEGIANYLWSICNKTERKQFVERALENSELARGLGLGLGFLHAFFKDDDIFKDLSRKSPDFRAGFGTGMGRAYRYLSDEARSEAFHMAESDIEFSIGLGEGIGSIYGLLERSQKTIVISYAGEGTGFSRGIGKGLGLVFPYFADDVKNEILGYAARNEQLSRGLGAGIAERISYLSEAVAVRIFEFARGNRLLAAGLGEGCGSSLSRLPQVTRDWLAAHADLDGFAVGFGIGVGKKASASGGASKQAAGMVKGDAFSEGVALGMGSIASRLSEAEFSSVLEKARKDDRFAINFTFGVGCVFSTLDHDRRKGIMDIVKDEAALLRSLGEGIGYRLPATGSRIVEEAIVAGLIELEKGVARGIAESFAHLDLAKALGVLQYASSYPEYGESLGQALSEKFVSLDEEKESMILDVSRVDSRFSVAFAKGIAKSLTYVSPRIRDRLNKVLAQFPHKDFGVEKGE